jgi:hypothetical protein
MTRPAAAKAAGQARQRARCPHKAVWPSEPPTANWVGPNEGNHSSTGVAGQRVAQRVLQEGVHQPAHDDQEESFQVAADEHAEEQAERPVAERDDNKGGQDGQQPDRPGCQDASRTSEVKAATAAATMAMAMALALAAISVACR